MTNVISMNDRDFERVREMAYAACGLSLHPGKRALVSSRLEKLVRRSGLGSFANYLNRISQKTGGKDEEAEDTEDGFAEFIDALTTHHSGFWREPEHFLFLQRKIMAGSPARLRIWSAGCATGEEPWTIAMCALESGATNCRILASDVSRRALNAAARGVYDQSRLRDLPRGWRSRYFEKDGADGDMRASEKVRALTAFRPLNLLHPFQRLGSFEAIFCRNVMIYFDRQTRDDLIVRLAAQVTPGGYLFLGHSETLLRVPPGLQYVQPAVYRKR